MIRGNRDVARRHPLVSVEEDKRDAPPLVHGSDDEGSRGNELELHLASSGGRAARRVVAVGVLEDDTFGSSGAEFIEGAALFVG